MACHTLMRTMCPMSARSTSTETGCVTRAVVFTLDPTPAQERLLVSYCGAARFAFNWALGQVTDNLAVRAAEREAGVTEADLTPAVSWSMFSLRKRLNGAKADVAPWHHEVAKHCFDTGINQAATPLRNWSASRTGKRRGRPVGFPRFKSRRRVVMSVSFVELNHQLSWLHEGRHAVRLMLPQSTPDRDVRQRRSQLAWIHTVESTRRVYRLVESGRATIQKVTIVQRGGRWQVSFMVRHKVTADVRQRPERCISTGSPIPSLTGSTSSLSRT